MRHNLNKLQLYTLMLRGSRTTYQKQILRNKDQVPLEIHSITGALKDNMMELIL